MDDALVRRLGLLAVAAGLAAALAAVAARGRGTATRDTSYRCGCGAKYRVSGVDRHRVYWPEGATDGAPVLGDACVRCGAALPAGHEPVTV